MKNSLKLTFVVSLIFSSYIPVSAQSIGILCANTKTKAINVARTACDAGQTKLTLSNISPTNSASCYSESSSKSGANSSGRVSVTVNCKSGFVVDSDSFSYSDETRAKPSLSSKTFTFANSSKKPTGATFEFTGEQNLFYTVSGQIVCCPSS